MIKKFRLITLVSVWLLATAYLSFQYFRIADFPIGHDVINHIQRSLSMQNESVVSVLRTGVYPIPALLFIWFYKIFNNLIGWDWPRVFLFTECFFLFLTALLSGIFAWTVFKKWPIVIVASLLVASSRWLLGSLITGLMGEAFGWAVFVLCLILMYQKRWLWFTLAFIFLAFSHPLPLGVMCVFLVAYLIYYSIWQKKYWALLGGLLIFVSLITLGYYALPEKKDAIIHFLKMKFPVEGEWRREYVIGSDFRRFNQYLLGGLGFCAIWLGKGNIYKEKRGPLLLFAVLSFFVTFKYVFGIHYLSFRYYTYFEILNSILAGLMVWLIANNLSEKIRQNIAKKIIYYSLIFVLAFLAIWPNINAGRLFTSSQLVENIATTTPIPERTLIEEASLAMPRGGIVLGQRRWVWWFQSYGLEAIYKDNIYDRYEEEYEDSPEDFLTKLRDFNISYIYLSSMDNKKSFEDAEYLRKIYDKENIRVYEVE